MCNDWSWSFNQAFKNRIYGKCKHANVNKEENGALIFFAPPEAEWKDDHHDHSKFYIAEPCYIAKEPRSFLGHWVADNMGTELIELMQPACIRYDTG